MNSSGNGGERESVSLALTRHQRRREQGIPTLSVLVGTREAAEAAWLDWVGRMGWTPGGVAVWPGENGTGEIGLPAGSPQRTVIYVNQSVADDRQERTQRLAAVVERLSRFLESLGPAQAAAVFAIAVNGADAEAYLCDEPFHRARTMFAEGMVQLPETPVETQAAGGRGDLPGALAPSAALLARQAVRGETAAGFATAAAAWQEAVSPKTGEGAADRARSAAERFLFDLLGDLPETAGLFELNVRLGFCFGPMPAEVDLLSTGLRLAVEIDGFHHFRDLENYRRDRRKDALLQKQGYLVLRFLAEDVVVRLEEILEEIRSAVAFRRATR